MGNAVGFMQSASGRLLRIVVGLALIVGGLLWIPDPWGVVVAIVGLVPVLAGVVGICLVAPVFGYTLQGAPRGLRTGQ